MTIRRKKLVEEETDKVPVGLNVPGLGVVSMRTLVMLLVFSMHPLGRSLLSTVGIRYPDEQKLNVATEKALDANNEIKGIKDDVKELKDSFAMLRADRAITNAKLDELAKNVNGFKMNLDDLRQHVDFKVSQPEKP